MARNVWLLDSRHIASKIKNVTQSFNQKEQSWKNSTTRSCPNCNHQIDNCIVAEKWPGFPIGVKFDPSDQQLLEHLAAKLGVGIDKPHPFIDQFIPTLEEEDGICYTHPEKLPGMKQDGSIAHFFYRTAKAYSTGTRRRRKVHCWTDQVGGYVRWHKTGKTRPVIVNGIQKGFKKIMVLYLTTTKGEKPEKTNWVMHQYHLGIEEDEKDSEFVVSKVFYQQQYRECNNSEQEVPQEAREISISNGDSLTPKTTTPELSRPAKRHKDLDTIPEGLLDCIDNPDPETPGTDDLIPSLSEHGHIGVEEEDLHEHDASDALADIELDTPPELQNIDLQSSSLESLLGWVRGKTD